MMLICEYDANLLIAKIRCQYANDMRMMRIANKVLRRCFEVFLFEDLPASDRRADEVYYV